MLPRLNGLTKAIYGVGRFLPPEDGCAVFALPNDVHRGKCEQKRPEVEAALQEHFGHPLPAQAGGRPGRRRRPGRQRAPEPEPEPDLDEHIDIRHTEPAPDVKTDVDRLTDAFPGAELLQEES